MFRFIAAAGRTLVIANTFGKSALLAIFVLGGFLIARGSHRRYNKCLFYLPYFFTLKTQQLRSNCGFEVYECFLYNIVNILQNFSFLIRRHSTMVEMGILGFSIAICADCSSNQ